MISVAVCTYNRCEYLARCIDALLRLFPAPSELIIVNDGSTDGTAAYLRQLTAQSSFQIQVLTHEKNRGLSEARNTAIHAARYPIIAFTDDDCSVDPHWIEVLQKPFEDEHVVAVYGQVFYRSRDYKGYFPERLVKNIGPAWPMGANIAYLTEALQNVGGFDPDFFYYHNEDSEMAYRLARVGRLVPAPNAIVTHQAIEWTQRSLLASARNASVWPVLYKKYGKEIFAQKFKPPVTWGRIVNVADYFYFLTLPVLIPLLLVRYFWHGKRDLTLFFCKWPMYLILRRLFIWYESVRNRVVMI